jgi:hypothetical protein
MNCIKFNQNGYLEQDKYKETMELLTLMYDLSKGKHKLPTSERIKAKLNELKLEEKEREIQLYKSKLEEKEREIVKLKSCFTPNPVSEEEFENDFIGVDEDNSFFSEM